MMKSDFDNMGISAPILKAIDEMGFKSPTEVQSKAIPHVLKQEDLIVMSKTGSGKTAVFGVPLLQMIDPGAVGPQGLILTPTRELAVQIDSDLKRMAKHLPHRTTAVYGQHSMNIEFQALDRGVSIVTGTPGRVYDHISHGHLKTRNIRFLVLDEADRMLDMGFLEQVVRIIQTLPRNRVTLLFSATIPPEVRRICQGYMKNPVTIEIESQTMTVDTTEQVYYRVNANEKNTCLNRLLLFEQPESCLIFCNRRNTVDRVQSFLDRKGYASEALHGEIPQSKRLKTIQQFKQGDFHVLVATDVAARGIHIDDLSLVINYDLPLEKDGYVHRIGRTGRAGHGGRAVTLVTGDDIMSLYEIEEHIGALIEEAEFPLETASDEYKASVEEWLRSNSQKRNKLRAASVSNGAGPGQKRAPSKPPQRPEKPREQPINRNATPKPDKQVNTTPKVEQAKTVQAIPKQPVSPSSPETIVVRFKPNPESTKDEAPATKKTFFQRLLHRILGRQRQA
jgi:superfamily II DNA/RNA helicase